LLIYGRRAATIPLTPARSSAVMNKEHGAGVLGGLAARAHHVGGLRGHGRLWVIPGPPGRAHSRHEAIGVWAVKDRARGAVIIVSRSRSQPGASGGRRAPIVIQRLWGWGRSRWVVVLLVGLSSCCSERSLRRHVYGGPGAQPGGARGAPVFPKRAELRRLLHPWVPRSGEGGLSWIRQSRDNRGLVSHGWRAGTLLYGSVRAGHRWTSLFGVAARISERGNRARSGGGRSSPTASRSVTPGSPDPVHHQRYRAAAPRLRSKRLSAPGGRPPRTVG